MSPFFMTFTVDGTAVTGAPAGWAAGQDDNPLDDQPIYEALVVGSIKAFDAVGSGSTAGSSYKDGTYDNVALNGGSGKNARAKLVIASNALSTITLTAAGEGYKDDEELTFDDADVGGGGGPVPSARSMASTSAPAVLLLQPLTSPRS